MEQSVFVPTVEETRATLEEFIAREGIFMTATKATANPNWYQDDRWEGAQHWLCTLTKTLGEVGKLEVPFSMGAAHRTVTRQAMLALRLGGTKAPPGWKIGNPMPHS